MKKIMIIAAVAAGVCVFMHYNTKELNAYKEYYKATEAFLDTLNEYENWVDGYDPYEYYDAKSKLKEYR